MGLAAGLPLLSCLLNILENESQLPLREEGTFFFIYFNKGITESMDLNGCDLDIWNFLFSVDAVCLKIVTAYIDVALYIQ